MVPNITMSVLKLFCNYLSATKSCVIHDNAIFGVINQILRKKEIVRKSSLVSQFPFILLNKTSAKPCSWLHKPCSWVCRHSFTTTQHKAMIGCRSTRNTINLLFIYLFMCCTHRLASHWKIDWVCSKTSFVFIGEVSCFGEAKCQNFMFGLPSCNSRICGINATEPDQVV